MASENNVLFCTVMTILQISESQLHATGVRNERVYAYAQAS
jgi:hypothetical protein